MKSKINIGKKKPAIQNISHWHASQSLLSKNYGSSSKGGPTYDKYRKHRAR